MKKRILAFLCLVLVTVFAFASCGDGEDATAECTHTFSEAWAMDATNHWHAATCEHGELKDSLAKHADVDEDGKCDACAYEIGHTHTFASEWTTDETSHWKAATCTHKDEKGESSLHLDENTDGACDVCTAHVHTLDGAGFCTDITCGKEVKPVDEADLGSVISATTARANRVVFGTVDFVNLITSSVSGEVTASIAHVSEYKYGTNGTYVNTTLTDSDGQTILEENWIPALDAEFITGVTTTKTNGVVTDAAPAAFGPDNLLGYYFYASTLADGYSPEILLSELYNRAFEESINKVDNFTVEHDAENNIYAFAYGILTINTDVAEGEDDNVNYYVVAVEFTYADDYTLLALEVELLCYTNTLADTAEHDFTYDQASKTITMKENASADTYTYSVQQTLGERTEIELEDGSKFTPTDFELYVDEALTTKLEKLDLVIGVNSTELYFALTPEGSFKSFLGHLDFVLTDKNGNVSDAVAFSLTGDVVYIVPNKPGEFTLTVTCGDIVKTAEVSVTGLELGGEHTFELTVTDNNCWVDFYEFVPTVAGQYTFYLPANFGIYSEERESAGTAPEVDPFNVDNSGYMGYNPAVEHTVTVVLRPGQTYRFYFGATTKGTFTIGYDAP